MTIFFDTTATISRDVANLLYPPISDGCIGYYELDGTETQALRNLVNPAAPLTKVGTPTFGADGVTCNPSAYLSGPADTAEFTRITVAKMIGGVLGTQSTWGFFLGNFLSGPITGSGLFVSGGTAWIMAAWVADNNRLVPMTNPNVWLCMSHRYAPPLHLANNWTEGQSLLAGSQPTYVPPSPARPLLIGAGQYGAAPGTTKTVRTLLYNRALSDADYAAAAAWLISRAEMVDGVVMGA